MLGLTAGLGAILVGSILDAETQGRPAKKTIDFNRDVRPILAKSCWPCHGPDPEPLKKTGDMRLDSFAGATQDRGGYRAIEPGKPEKSEMIARISDEARRMPPAASGLKPLTKQEQDILRTWIAEGAEYRAHWAFVPPKPPAIPKTKNDKWIRNPIDAFVLEQLEDAKLAPEPEADRSTLLRRASLTLTGLPPSPSELDAFLADTKPGAYERAVDRLLNSPRYGENQARYWLDAVRYADTHGLHIDNERAVYPYRDWVVRAFNEDLPFDQFTTWQLAGDLLPSPTLDQKIATGYIRMNPTTNEGGVIEEEFLAKNTMDRVDTTSTIFLGVTLGCAKCHDHKYDPFTMKDYYGMYAFFNSTTDPVLDGNLKLHQPVMKAPTSDQAKRLEAMTKQIEALIAKKPIASARTWAATSAPQLPAASTWETAGPYSEKDFDSAFATAFEPERPDAKVEWKKIGLEVDKPLAFGGKMNTATYVRGVLHLDVARKVPARISSDDGVKVWLGGKLIHENKVLRGLQQSYDMVTLDLPAGDTQILIKVVNSGGGDGVFIGFGDERDRQLSRAFDLGRKATLTAAESRELTDLYYRLGPENADAKAFRAATAQRAKLDEEIPYTYIAEEMKKPRETRILKRGNYATPGDLIDRMVPASLGALPPNAPKNRLGLAKWLTDPKNPLVARVFVNRVWQQHFGRGLVESAEDFGSRGEWPTHPELLDYLAIRFVQDGWSLKRLHRLIVTSASFRQAGTASPDKRAKDPLNKLISRGPRFRLDAEVIRDTALYVSGLLVERPGGHGDKVYQPSGLWEAIAYPISDTAKYVQDHGDALHRRSLYLFWKRTSPPPTMLLFDAPMRESCVVRRSATNTPTQALATLNETGFVEAARAFAQRILKAPAKGDAGRLTTAFRLALGRKPGPEETKAMLDLLASERADFGKSRDSAVKLLSIGESKRDVSLDPVAHASWMTVCSVILNLDEAMTQH